MTGDEETFGVFSTSSGSSGSSWQSALRSTASATSVLTAAARPSRVAVRAAAFALPAARSPSARAA